MAGKIREIRAVGRPPKYDPSFPAKVLAMGAVMPAEIAASLNCSESSLYAWCHQHPEFLEAFNAAKSAFKAVLLRKGLTGEYNATFAKFLASGMYGINETTKTETEISGPGGQPLAVTVAFK